MTHGEGDLQRVISHPQWHGSYDFLVSSVFRSSSLKCVRTQTMQNSKMGARMTCDDNGDDDNDHGEK